MPQSFGVGGGGGGGVRKKKKGGGRSRKKKKGGGGRSRKKKKGGGGYLFLQKSCSTHLVHKREKDFVKVYRQSRSQQTTVLLDSVRYLNTT